MKLVFAIIHDDDSQNVTDELSSKGFTTTKLCSTGGFLRSGNTTLLIGVENGMVDSVIEIIKNNTRIRKQLVNSNTQAAGKKGRLSSRSAGKTGGIAEVVLNGANDTLKREPDQVIIGRAIIFITNVEKFEKV